MKEALLKKDMAPAASHRHKPETCKTTPYLISCHRHQLNDMKPIHRTRRAHPPPGLRLAVRRLASARGESGAGNERAQDVLRTSRAEASRRLHAPAPAQPTRNRI